MHLSHDKWTSPYLSCSFWIFHYKCQGLFMLERNTSHSQHIHPKTPGQQFPKFKILWTSFYKNHNIHTVTSWLFTFYEFLSDMSLPFHQVPNWFTHCAKLNPLEGDSQLLPFPPERIAIHLTMCLEPNAYTLSEKDQHYFSELSLNNNTVTQKPATIHLMGFINQIENHCPRETEREKKIWDAEVPYCWWFILVLNRTLVMSGDDEV